MTVKVKTATATGPALDLALAYHLALKHGTYCEGRFSTVDKTGYAVPLHKSVAVFDFLIGDVFSFHLNNVYTCGLIEEFDMIIDPCFEDTGGGPPFNRSWCVQTAMLGMGHIMSDHIDLPIAVARAALAIMVGVECELPDEVASNRFPKAAIR